MEAQGGRGAGTSALDTVEGKWGVRVHRTQGMQGKEGTGDPRGPDANSGRYSSRSGLCPSGEKGFFADAAGASLLYIERFLKEKWTRQTKEDRERIAEDSEEA